MKVERLVWTGDGGWDSKAEASGDADLVLYFGAREALAGGARFDELRARFPKAKLVGCSTGGEIADGEAHDDRIVVSAVRFGATTIDVAAEEVEPGGDSYAAGRRLGAKLSPKGLRGMFVLSDGTRVNGSALVRGLRDERGDVTITGGLAGDGARFGETLVGANATPAPGRIAAIGFYGDAIRVGHACAGGWDAFGPTRIITRSSGNVLYELDGEPALDLYKRYLGAEASKLPGSALLFPICIRRQGDRAVDLVRTILNVDHDARTMTFAGDMPEGAVVQLMRGSISQLVAGAAEAARNLAAGQGSALTVLVSCIGRKLLMGQRASDEVEAVVDVVGKDSTTMGFYSYGEISPHVATGCCELHNQTMTITRFTEV